MSASPLRYHPREEYYSCAGCRREIEVPRRIQADPEERLAWLEAQESAHAQCREAAELAMRLEWIQ